MHVSRKRYRPLDTAEERAVHANQRVHLLPLDDEQSYCFSWPEAPLTLWMQENTTYAALHQLIAGASGGGPSSSAAGTTGGHAAVSASSVGGGAAESTGGRGRASGAASSAVAHLAASPSLSTSSSSSSRRQIELPPVFSLGDIRTEQGVSVDDDDDDSDTHQLLQRIQHEMIAVHRQAGSGSDANRGGSTTTARPWAAIQLPEEPPRPAPHPLAPPRPQSITEDSVFSLSAPQLADVVAAGVPALMAEAAAAAAKESHEGQDGTPASSHAAASAVAATQTDAKTNANSSPYAASARSMVVVVEESSEGTASAAPKLPPTASTSAMTEAQRRAIEHEVVGLEWRTWTQSQRTAAALQRLLSLEAAVPYEPSGDASADVWRAVVYRLWLRWRQQGWADAAAPQASAKPGSPADSSAQASPTHSGPATLPPPPPLSHAAGAFLPPHRLPWGAALLPGAYLYGTSNDYFISLPPATACGPSALSTHATHNSSSSSSSGGGSNGASFWPAMSRRRGVYHFLRWRVELYEAQLSQRRGADAGATSALDGNSDDSGVSDGDDNDGDGGGESARALHRGETSARTPSRYAKGPLGETKDAKALLSRPRRRAGAEAAAAAAAASAAASAPPDAAPCTRRSAAARAGATAASVTEVHQHPQHHSLHTVLSASHIKALLSEAVLTEPLTELEMDDEPSAVMERLSCPDLRHETDAWRVWLSKV